MKSVYAYGKTAYFVMNIDVNLYSHNVNTHKTKLSLIQNVQIYVIFFLIFNFIYMFDDVNV